MNMRLNRRLVRKPSPAMVVACAALAIALSGTGYAVTALPRNSVGTAQLKANAVVASKVRDRSLLERDFKQGELPAGPAGPAGAAGPQGSQGPPGAQGTQGPAGERGLPGETGAQGAPGASGAQGPAGPKGDGFRWRGAFDCNGSYAPGDVVAHNGSAWITQVGIGGCVDPPFSPWELLVQRGEQGPQGEQGQQGQQGQQGPVGPPGPPGPQGPQGPPGSGTTDMFWAQNAVNPFGATINVPREDDGFAEMGSLALQPGKYLVVGKVNLENNNGAFAQDNRRFVMCFMAGPDGAIDRSMTRIEGGAIGIVASFVIVTNLSSPGNVTLQCRLFGSGHPPGVTNVKGGNVSIGAVKR